MSSILLFLTQFTACICYVIGQSPCTTPSGGNGTCKSIYQCGELLALITKNMTSQNMDFLKRSQCGFLGKTPAVCCPQPCLNVEGLPGQCVNIFSCPHLKAMLVAPVSMEKIEYLRRSRCEGPAQFSVCCGPQQHTARVSSTPLNSCEAILTSYPPDPHSKCCGKDSSFGNKIIGGAMTAIDQYPWLALIEYNKGGTIKTLCGGALISAKYVLTAAHCVSGVGRFLGTPVNIRLGEYDSLHANPDCVTVEANGEDCNEDLVVIPIAQTIPHPGFSRRMGNDIALIRMQRMAPYTDFIRPICLPSVDLTLSPPDRFTLIAAGWGVTGVSHTIKTHNPKMDVDLPFVTTEACSSFYEPRVHIRSSQICAGGVAGKDSCKGDSGGPLMFENNRTYEAIGVVSFGPLPCAQANKPSVYTKVFDYKDWIMSNIRP